MRKRKRRSFTAEFKQEAVRLCEVGDRSIAQVAKDLDLTETALRDWVKRAEIDAGKGPVGALTTAEREELTRLRRENERLQMEREIPKKSGGLLREGEHVKFVFIHAERALYPVRVLCSVLGVSRSGYYAWIDRPETARTKANEQLVVEIVATHARSRATYGSPRVHLELRARGIRVGRKRIERLMRERGIQARRKRRFRRTTDSKHAHSIAPNVLARNFAVKSANAVWVTDVTCIWTAEGWTFLAVILDLFARRVVGWAASETNDTELALAALRNALRDRNPSPGLIHHSDRGSPYASGEYQLMLAERGIVASMSRKGDCWDNAVAESFFATIKTELIEHEEYATHDAAVASIAEYIERFYNPQRRHSHLGHISPIEFELKAQVAALAA